MCFLHLSHFSTSTLSKFNIIRLLTESDIIWGLLSQNKCGKRQHSIDTVKEQISKRGPQISTITITWEHIRNGNS